MNKQVAICLPVVVHAVRYPVHSWLRKTKEKVEADGQLDDSELIRLSFDLPVQLNAAELSHGFVLERGKKKNKAPLSFVNMHAKFASMGKSVF